MFEKLNLDKKRLAKVSSLFNGNPLKIVYYSGTEREGYKLVLGAGIGVTHFEALLHEMGHLIEISDDRVLVSDFGMDNDPGPEGYNWKKGLKRELKALAWEWVIFDYFKMTFPQRTKTITRNCDQVLWMSGTYNQGDLKSREKYFLYKVSKYHKKYTVKKFLKEWDRKMGLLQKGLKK